MPEKTFDDVKIKAIVEIEELLEEEITDEIREAIEKIIENLADDIYYLGYLSRGI
jgi:hypothetical protein